MNTQLHSESLTDRMTKKEKVWEVVIYSILIIIALGWLSHFINIKYGI
jgi:hypothetical protein